MTTTYKALLAVAVTLALANPVESKGPGKPDRHAELVLIAKEINKSLPTMMTPSTQWMMTYVTADDVFVYEARIVTIEHDGRDVVPFMQAARPREAGVRDARHLAPLRRHAALQIPRQKHDVPRRD